MVVTPGPAGAAGAEGSSQPLGCRRLLPSGLDQRLEGGPLPAVRPLVPSIFLSGASEPPLHGPGAAGHHGNRSFVHHFPFSLPPPPPHPVFPSFLSLQPLQSPLSFSFLDFYSSFSNALALIFSFIILLFYYV